MKHLTRSRLEAIRARVREHMSEWREFHGNGPCYPVSVVLCRAGFGRLTRGATFDQQKKRWYGHYVCVSWFGEKILDATGEYLHEKRRTRVRYKGLKPVHDFPHEFYPETCMQFWQERLGDLL